MHVWQESAALQDCLHCIKSLGNKVVWMHVFYTCSDLTDRQACQTCSYMTNIHVRPTYMYFSTSVWKKATLASSQSNSFTHILLYGKCWIVVHMYVHCTCGTVCLYIMYIAWNIYMEHLKCCVQVENYMEVMGNSIPSCVMLWGHIRGAVQQAGCTRCQVPSLPEIQNILFDCVLTIPLIILMSVACFYLIGMVVSMVLSFHLLSISIRWLLRQAFPLPWSAQSGWCNVFIMCITWKV